MSGGVSLVKLGHLLVLKLKYNSIQFQRCHIASFATTKQLVCPCSPVSVKLSFSFHKFFQKLHWQCIALQWHEMCYLLSTDWPTQPLWSIWRRTSTSPLHHGALRWIQDWENTFYYQILLGWISSACCLRLKVKGTYSFSEQTYIKP